MTEEKKTKVVFMPGCFDDFDGTQEELDELVKEIQRLANSPEELMANSREVNLTDLDDEILEIIGEKMQSITEDTSKKLH